MCKISMEIPIARSNRPMIILRKNVTTYLYFNLSILTYKSKIQYHSLTHSSLLLRNDKTYTYELETLPYGSCYALDVQYESIWKNSVAFVIPTPNILYKFY